MEDEPSLDSVIHKAPSRPPPPPDGGAKRRHCTVESCGYSTPSKKDLERHMRKHTGEKPFACEICRKSYSRRDKLSMHQRTHAELKPYKCKLCDYCSISADGLKRHGRCHSEERPFKCQLCSYAAKTKSQLVVHVRSHTGDCPYSCLEAGCSSAFTTLTDLKRHGRRHSGVKPHACEQCGFKTATKGNLTKHFRSMHGSEDVKDEIMDGILKDWSTKKKAVGKDVGKVALSFEYACKNCEFRAASIKMFADHLKAEHCALIAKEGKSGVGEETSRLHERTRGRDRQSFIKKRKLRTVNKGPIAAFFDCTFCDASFVTKDSWRAHVKLHNEREGRSEGNFASNNYTVGQDLLEENSTNSLQDDESDQANGGQDDKYRYLISI